MTVLFPPGWLAGFCYDGLPLLGWLVVVRLGDLCFAERLLLGWFAVFMMASYCWICLLLLGWPDVVRLGDGCYADRLCEAGWLLLCWLATC